MKISNHFKSIVLISSAFWIGCTTKVADQNNLQYLEVRRNGMEVDTLRKELTNSTFSDSIYMLTYSVDRDWLNIQKFELPISTSNEVYKKLQDTTNNRFRLVDTKSIYYEGDIFKNYIVYKYLFDDPKVADEEMLLFFVPEFGILIEKAAWWGNYGRLITNGDVNDNDELFYLNEMIISDSDFFHNWTFSLDQQPK